MTHDKLRRIMADTGTMQAWILAGGSMDEAEDFACTGETPTIEDSEQELPI